MRRLVVPVVVAALLSLPGPTALLHVHAYADHDHADHHHGPAVHRHGGAGHQREPGGEGTARVERCDPDAHAVPYGVNGLAAQPNHPSLPATVEAMALPLPPSTWRSAMPRDDRAHGPPRRSTGSPRAPPPVIPARS